MKKIEINAFSIKEAKEKAKEMGIAVVANVTPSYIKRGKPSGDNFTVFATEMMEKRNLTDIRGAGLIVSVKNGSADTRLHPYTFKNNVINGTRKFQRVNEIRLKSTDQLVGEASKKDDAIKLAKQLMNQYKEDMICKIVYRTIDVAEEVAFELDYTPSKDTTEGTYIVFGNTTVINL
jgi:hypothetical protein